jgi:glycerol-3-phosphate dehydrogenase (NAD(P)+)
MSDVPSSLNASNLNRGPLSIGVVSAGAWGTALGILANRAGSRVVLHSNNEYVLDSIERLRSNEIYLPGIFIDPAIQATRDTAEVYGCDMVLLAVPSHHMRATCIQLSDQIDPVVPIILATKGVERGSFALMSEIAASILPRNPVAVLTGPNFAGEAARGLPTATTIACADFALAERIIHAIGGKYFRPYHTPDLIGAQVGGAVKNVIAIACGIAIGKGLGENARAALITRGMVELKRLCRIKGGQTETLMGLSGIGDIMLTCASPQSRNMALGIELGQAKMPLPDILERWRKKLVEGMMTADSIHEYAQRNGISMPICKAVSEVINARKTIDHAIEDLLSRPFIAEEK